LYIYGICSILFLPGAKIAGFAGLDIWGWLLVIFLGLNTLIAYGAVALAFKHLEANKVSVILTMNPIITFGIMYLFYFFDVQLIAFEHFTIKGIIGAIIALSGSAFVIFFTRQRAQK
jgi:drug/metabolite transporter (DMT)-like permease